jgi:hypothetical protein
MKKKKKNRGGQKGNQNARKHGFYASSLTPDETCRFLNILNQEGLDPDVAVLRIKVQGVLEQAPGNHRVFYDASRVIAKRYASKYQFDRSERSYLKAIVNAGLQQVSGLEPDPFKFPGKLL